MTYLAAVLALLALAALVAWHRSRPREEAALLGWQWSWSPGTKPPVVQGDTVTASLQGECSWMNTLKNWMPHNDSHQNDAGRTSYPNRNAA